MSCFGIVSTCKRLVPGAIPTLNLPEKSIPSTSTSAPRRELVRHELKRKPYYTSLDDLKKKAEKLKLTGWSKSVSEKYATLVLWDEIYALPKLAVTIEDSLNLTVAVYNWLLPDEHTFYLTNKRSVRHTTLSSILSSLEQFQLCNGLPVDEPFISVAVDPSSDNCFASIIRHTVPINREQYEANGPPFQTRVFLRSHDCHVLCDGDKCDNCVTREKSIQNSSKAKAVKEALPVPAKAPLSATSKGRLVATIQEQRVLSKELEEKIAALEAEIEKNSVAVNETLEKDLLEIFANNPSMEVTPHMNVFWEQQRKLIASSKFGRRYHPHIIRFCLSLHAKSPAAYKELQESGILVLPSQRTLRDFRNFFKPKPGFNLENIERLIDLSKEYFDIQRYVVLGFDEMKIQSKLVFDKRSNELVGFVDLGEEQVNEAFCSTDELATHALVFLVRGVATDLKYTLAYFLTKDVTSYQLMSLFWKAVCVLELACNLWVCATVSDGASPNRRFYELHAEIAGNSSEGIVHATVNLFCPSRKKIFFSDAPHLVKTTRNCLFNSGSGKRTRNLWNNGKYLPWEHIAKLYFFDLDHGLHQLPKLTMDHIDLKSFSKMKVHLAVQVMSKTVSLALKRYFTEGEADETAKLCEMTNDFFNCLNVRSFHEHKRKRNALLAPYRSSTDVRFDWLENVFLKYLSDWFSSTQTRPGMYTPEQRAQMFLSTQTYKGLQITIKSVVQVTKFLLGEGCEGVLTERFCQDDVEEYFGYQRAPGRRSDNPTAADFGYNDLRISVLRDIAPTAEGNVAGRHIGPRTKWYTASEEPLPKRSKKEVTVGIRQKL